MKAAVRVLSATTASPELSAQPHPNRVPDGEYLAVCKHVHHDCQSRNYGERIYLDLPICEGEFFGKVVRMFLRPSVYPTSNFYRAWAIARGGPPRSHNTRMSPRVFVGKVFKVLTATVRPRHRIAGDDGKMRPGPFLPESFWYSKVACIVSLEVTNEKIVPIPTLNTTEEGGLRPPAPPVIVTEISPNPFPTFHLSEGEVGRRELGDGSMRGNRDLASARGNHHNAPPPAGEEEKGSSPAPSPQPSRSLSRRELIRSQAAEILQKYRCVRAEAVND